MFGSLEPNKRRVLLPLKKNSIIFYFFLDIMSFCYFYDFKGQLRLANNDGRNQF